ncbi:MAG: HDOD domain-containing protein [Burkholderiales bacterium]
MKTFSADRIDYWVGRLGHGDLPVLARTAAELSRLAADEDMATPQKVSDIVLHDPLMTFKVLQFIQLHRHASQETEITTIAHALMMLGLSPFFRHFSGQPTLEALLRTNSPALSGARMVASRARHAALYARDWAAVRHDIEVDEVMAAALLHDVAELLLWCAEPDLALQIDREMQADRTLRSEQAQRKVLGISLVDVQLHAARAWRLPEVLQGMMNDHRVTRPREANVINAVAVARHSARGWQDAALVHDYREIGRLLGQSADSARARVVRVALQAAREWTWYGVRPAAAWLPLIAELPLPAEAAAIA